MVHELRTDLPVWQELQWIDICRSMFIKVWFPLGALRDACRRTRIPLFAFTLRNQRNNSCRQETFLKPLQHLTVCVFSHFGASKGKAIPEKW